MRKIFSIGSSAALLFLLAGTGIAQTAKTGHDPKAKTATKLPAKGKTQGKPATGATAVTVIPLTNMIVNGKKVWLPAEVKARRGKVRFILNNTLDVPHGFQVMGVMKQGIVVPAKKSIEVPVVDLNTRKKFELKCHMHPAHVSAFVETY